MAEVSTRLKKMGDTLSVANGTVALFGALGLGTAMRALLKTLGKLPNEWITPIWLLTAAIAMVALIWLLKRFREQDGTQQAVSTVSTTLTNATRNVASSDFDSAELFRIAYFGPVQTQFEVNVRAEAARVQADDKESFYLKLIGVGGIAYIYDLIWWPMFKSQLLALLELNRKSGRLPLTAFETFYSAAATTYPMEYATDTFERWMTYFTNNGLLVRHPSEMLEITHKGKDFLKYLLHWGREPEMKRL